MAIESAADRLAMLDPDEFGATASYTPAGGQAASIVGIFDNEYVGVDLDAGVPIESRRPTFLVRAADVPAVAHDDALTVDGTDYVVAGVEPDGTGFVKLVLAVAP